jgi:WD40 domain-containing protein
MPRPFSRSSIAVRLLLLALPVLCNACDRDKAPTQTPAAQPGGAAASLDRYEPEARSLGISGRDPLFARGRRDGTILLREGREGRHQRVLVGDGIAVTSLSFSPDGASLASGSQNGTVRLWESRSGRQVALRHDHTTPVGSFIFSPDGRFLVSMGRDARLLVHEVPGLHILHDLTSLAGQADATQWVLTIAPVKTTQDLPTSVEPRASGQQLTALATTAVTESSPATESTKVIFRAARMQVRAEYLEESSSPSTAGSPAYSEETHETHSKTLATKRRVARAVRPEPVLAMTLSLEPAAELGDAAVSRVSFRLFPCSRAARPCSAPELSLETPQTLANSETVEASRIAESSEPNLAPMISLAEPIAAFETSLAFHAWHRESYHLPMLAFFDSFKVRKFQRLADISRSGDSWLEKFSDSKALIVEDFVAFSRDSSTLSWESPMGLVHVLDLRQNQYLRVFPFAPGSGRGEWRARLLETWRVKNFSTYWSKWEIQSPDWSFLLVKVFLENRLPRESFLPLAGVYLRTEGAFFSAIGVEDQGIRGQDGRAGVAIRGHGEEAQVFVFVVPHSVAGSLRLHILDLAPIDLAG